MIYGRDVGMSVMGIDWLSLKTSAWEGPLGLMGTAIITWTSRLVVVHPEMGSNDDFSTP